MMSMPRSDRTLALRGVQLPLYQATLARAKDDSEKARALGMLGNALSALGRREEALAATQEAVELYRQLAQANPQAFLPDLARSLGAHGAALLGLGHAAEAAQAFGEGLQALLPFLRAYPQAFGGLAGALLNYYLRACEQSSQPLDAALVQAVRQALA